jgi:very-short-patch-repair endonuclease
MGEGPKNPPRNGEGDRAAKRRGGGGSSILRAPIKTVKLARKLRKEMSLAEVLLWRELKKRPGDYRFRRQLPSSPYAVDFACLSARLGIEVDGEAHDTIEQAKRDIRRDVRIEADGLKVLRIPAWEVFRNMEGVLSWIVAHCSNAGPLHHRPWAGGPPPRSGEDLQ